MAQIGLKFNVIVSNWAQKLQVFETHLSPYYLWGEGGRRGGRCIASSNRRGDQQGNREGDGRGQKGDSRWREVFGEGRGGVDR